MLEKEILKPMKRIEIVIDENSLDALLKLLRDANVRGYTIIKKAGGFGSTGERNPDDYALELPNAIMVLACEDSQAAKIISILQPNLRSFGGMCLVTDCQWVTGPAVSY